MYEDKKVVVVHKTSRLDFEQMKRPDMSDHDIGCMVSLSSTITSQSLSLSLVTPKLTEGGVDYNYLRERHRTHTQSLTEIHSFLE